MTKTAMCTWPATKPMPIKKPSTSISTPTVATRLIGLSASPPDFAVVHQRIAIQDDVHILRGGGGQDSPLRHLQHRQHRMALLRGVTDKADKSMRPAGAEAGKVLDPMVGIGLHDMQAGRREGLPVGERRVRRGVPEQLQTEVGRRQQRIPLGHEHRSASLQDGAGDAGQGGRPRPAQGSRTKQADGKGGQSDRQAGRRGMGVLGRRMGILGGSLTILGRCVRVLGRGCCSSAASQSR